MNKFYLLPIIALLSTGLANAISQEMIDCAKVYTAALGISFPAKHFAPLSMTIETIGHTASVIGSPIKSIFSTTYWLANGLNCLLVEDPIHLKIEIGKETKMLANNEARLAMSLTSVGIANIKSIPAIIGLGVIPYFVKQNKEINLLLKNY